MHCTYTSGCKDQAVFHSFSAEMFLNNCAPCSVLISSGFRVTHSVFSSHNISALLMCSSLVLHFVKINHTLTKAAHLHACFIWIEHFGDVWYGNWTEQMFIKQKELHNWVHFLRTAVFSLWVQPPQCLSRQVKSLSLPGSVLQLFGS